MVNRFTKPPALPGGRFTSRLKSNLNYAGVTETVILQPGVELLAFLQIFKSDQYLLDCTVPLNAQYFRYIFERNR